MKFFYNEQEIRKILTTIRKPDSKYNDYFEIFILKEKNEKLNAYYNRSKNKIVFYLFNYKNNNDLIRSAIHEYAHYFMPGWVGHAREFWNYYFELLEIAEMKGFYSCNIEKSDKLKQITAIIIKHNLIKTKKIFRNKLNLIFPIIIKLCDEININFQHYTVKYLEMDWYKKKTPPNTLYKKFWTNCVIIKNIRGDIDQNLFLPKFFIEFPL